MIGVTRNLILVILNIIILLILNFILIEPRIFYSRSLLNVVEMDFTSYFMKITIELIMLLSIIATYNEIVSSKKSLLIFLIVFINIIILFLIYCESQIIFYILFEISVIPIFLIITGWGYQPERLSAAYALIFYTILFSFPLIMMITFSFKINFTRELRRIIWLSSKSLIGKEIYIYNITTMFFMGGFLVKLPMYLIHLWLPKAHVEAPVFGSIELAGILLKLGGIGLIRFLPLLNSSNFIDLVISLRMLGRIIVSIICVTNIDIKVIIALSSVVHISIVIIPFLVFNNLSIITRIIVIVTHAFGSSGMFFIAFIFYSRSFSRNLLINKGVLRYDPLSTMIWIFFIIACISAPPRINLFAEILSLISVISLIPFMSIIIFFSVMISTAFSLIIYSSTQQGIRSYENFYKIRQCQIYGLLISFIHLFCIILPLLMMNKFII